MVKATYSDKSQVTEILTKSFDDNKSVNYIVKKDTKRKKRIMRLMEYSFEICHHFGDVFLSDDGNGCALLLYPDKKKTTFKSIWWNVKLIATCTGLRNVLKTLSREGEVKKLHPPGPLCYLWFIGVQPSKQGKGTGSRLLQEIIRENEKLKRTICLETSTMKNLPWYQKLGFTVYNELDISYHLFFLKRR